jgi:polyhydroxyalkanoate synthesis regulator phasin
MKKVLIVVAAVAALGVAAVAVAQEGAGGGSAADAWTAKVAEKLGVTEDELAAAMKDAQFELIDEAVAEGRITQEQADAIKARAEESGNYFPHRPGVDGKRACLAVKFTVRAAAEVLGMEHEALVEALQSGQSLAEIAEAQGMNVEDFKAALLEQAQEDLDALVAEGKLTQDQADRLHQAFSEHIDQIVNSHPDGEHRPCRGHGGGSEGEAPQDAARFGS